MVTAVKAGIVVRANMIIGFPYETRKNIWQTLKFQWQLAIMGIEEIPLFPFQPYPGTEIFDALQKKDASNRIVFL